jgi:hypothetical protein
MKEILAQDLRGIQLERQMKDQWERILVPAWQQTIRDRVEKGMYTEEEARIAREELSK